MSVGILLHGAKVPTVLCSFLLCMQWIIVDAMARPTIFLSYVLRAKELIRNLLSVDPHQRLTAGQCLRHPWVTGPRNSIVPAISSAAGSAAGREEGPLLVGAHARLQQAYTASLGGSGFAAAMAASRVAGVGAGVDHGSINA